MKFEKLGFLINEHGTFEIFLNIDIGLPVALIPLLIMDIGHFCLKKVFFPRLHTWVFSSTTLFSPLALDFFFSY